MSHYRTTIPEGCRCHYTEQRIPGEPHIPAYLDAEPNIECPVHFTDMHRAEDRFALLFMVHIEGSVSSPDGTDHALEGSSDGDGWDEPQSENYSCTCEGWDLTWIQTNPECTGRPSPQDVFQQWLHHVWPARSESVI